MTTTSYRDQFHNRIAAMDDYDTFTLDDACDWFPGSYGPCRNQIASYIRGSKHLIQIKRTPSTYQKIPEDYIL